MRASGSELSQSTSAIMAEPFSVRCSRCEYVWVEPSVGMCSYCRELAQEVPKTAPEVRTVTDWKAAFEAVIAGLQSMDDKLDKLVQNPGNPGTPVPPVGGGDVESFRSALQALLDAFRSGAAFDETLPAVQQAVALLNQQGTDAATQAAQLRAR